MNKKSYKDTDPQETQDWLDSINAILETSGINRTHFIIEKIVEYARRHGVRMPYSATTDYVNTIPVSQQAPYPGDRDIERRIKSLIRWNAMAMVVRANRDNSGIGGHISSFASAATLYEVAFNHFLRGPNYHNGDLVFIQGHSAPGIYARAFLENRINENELNNFRRELSNGGGLSSYPHPWLMPNFWQFPTVSMGLGPIMAIYQARFMHYMHDRKMMENNNRKVWAFLGDGEMDEPESMGALTLAAREELDNLIFVVNCNLQRLDGPVRGNGKIIQELEGAFRGAGWNVIKVVWGSEWDQFYNKNNHEFLIKRFNEMVDGDSLKYIVEDGDYFRKHFWGKYPELLDFVKTFTNDEISQFRVGGHDPAKVYAAYHEAINHKGQPTVILAQTIKGYGLGEAGEGRNITHQQKKLNEEELLHFRSRFNIPLSDEECIKAPFYKPNNDSEEIKYLKKQRNKLGGFLPQRSNNAPSINIPNINILDELLEGSGDRKISTTMAFVRLLTILTKDKLIGKYVVPIIPDEARTFGIEPLFRQLGIYSHSGQVYEPVDSNQFLYYREATDGQILEEGINEAGSISSFIAAGTSYSNHNINMIPFFIYYSMFGFQRIGDFIWAAADMRTKGFLLGGTAGRTTLAGEGLQHQDGHSHLIASTIPNLKAYDPAFAYEIAIIIHEGLNRMYNKQEDIFYYITLENENYIQPSMPQGVNEGIIKGMYQLKSGQNQDLKVQLLASGSMVNEIIEASKLLKSDWNIESDIWSVTSFSELHKEAEDKKRWNTLHPNEEKKSSFVGSNLKKENGPVIAVSDYVKLVAEQIAPYIECSFSALGTDGFGRSETRENLRNFFEINRYYIVLAAMESLYSLNLVSKNDIMKVIKLYKLDTEKPNPITV